MIRILVSYFFTQSAVYHVLRILFSIQKIHAESWVSKHVLQRSVEEIFLAVKDRMVSALCLCVRQEFYLLVCWLYKNNEPNVLLRANLYFHDLKSVRLVCPWTLLCPSFIHLSCLHYKLHLWSTSLNFSPPYPLPSVFIPLHGCTSSLAHCHIHPYLYNVCMLSSAAAVFFGLLGFEDGGMTLLKCW
jgi:hypothetical protein